MQPVRPNIALFTGKDCALKEKDAGSNETRYANTLTGGAAGGLAGGRGGKGELQ